MVRCATVVVVMLLGWVQANSQARPATEAVHNKKKDSFFQRLTPGITFQYPGRGHGGIDFNPYIGYEITSKLTAGLGWNERLSFRFRHHFGIGHRRGVYGPRAFVDYKLFKGFSGRAEVETMNTYVPPLLGVSPAGAEGSRKFVWGIFIGVKKNFRITNRIRVNAQVLYNFYDGVYNVSPYADRLNLRLGLEFSLRKRSP